MPNNIVVHPMDVRGTKYEVAVTEGGMFTATADGQPIYKETREELRAELMKITAKAAVQISIPFTLMTGGRASKGIVTGLHGGNGNLLVQWLTGRAVGKSQWTPSYYDIVFAGHVSDEVIDRWLTLRKIAAEAEKDLTDYQNLLKIDLQDEAVKAVEDAVRPAIQAEEQPGG